MNLVQTIVPNI